MPAAQAHIAGERKRSRWNKARLSLVVPIGAIVAVAIVCVVIAVLTSARRADEVSTSREQSLLETAIAGKGLRLYVEQGGCSGMQYSMVFDEKRPDDFSVDMHGVSVLVDPFSAKYLRGTVVDFSDDLTGGGFKISNPNAKQSCGCGKSFEA